MQQWEYLVKPWRGAITEVDDVELQAILNDYGAEGWELVNIIPQIGGFQHQTTVDFNQLIFKRIK